MHFFTQLFPDPTSDFPLIAVILGLPAIGAIVNGVFGKRLGPQAVKTMALAAVFGPFAAAVLSFLLLWGHAGGGEDASHVKFVWHAWQWLALSEGRSVDVAFSVDTLSATMMLVVTGVGGLIHLYATGYMAGDPGYHRFFAYLNLFILAMLVLVLGDSLPILFVGWEGVGLCSYLLIGFWFDVEKNAAAGKKAFIVNRIGDFGLLVAMAMIFHFVGDLSWSGIESGVATLADKSNELEVWPIGSGGVFTALGLGGSWKVPAVTLVALALFLGCAGKSAQIPLYVWLPDAMAGPTPVSALIHAATMVTAGVYLVARMSFVFVASPGAMMVVAGVGALTALFAATIGLVQNDIKKVLAYSTVSQLGYMFLGVGVGAFAAGIFHVFTHAFFKACLFLCAGSVIHAMHARIHDTDASQDMRNMGGLRKYMPYTFWTYVLATAAIVGFPASSGFFSKDEILFRAFANRVGSGVPEWFPTALFVVGVTGAVLTAFYMVRSLVLTFFGPFRGWKIVPGWKDPHAGHGHDDSHDGHGHAGADKLHDGPVPHESPAVMTVPLMILAFFAVVAGFLNAGPLHLTPFHEWLTPSFGAAASAVRTVAEGEALTHLEHLLLIPGVCAFAIGVGAAWWVYYSKNAEPARVTAAKAGWLYRLVLDKWRIDELYEATIIGFVDALGETAALFDKWVVDGIIGRLTGVVTQSFGALFRTLQTGRVQMYAATMVVGLIAMAAFFAVPHAEMKVRTDAVAGQYVVQASPGLGYEYRWDLDATAGCQPESAWTRQREARLQLAPGTSRKVCLEVQNAFRLTERKEIELTRPLPDKSRPEARRTGGEDPGKGAAL